MPKKQPSGLIQAMDVLKNIKDISMIMFDERDVIRHHLVKQIIVAYNKLDE